MSTDKKCTGSCQGCKSIKAAKTDEMISVLMDIFCEDGEMTYRRYSPTEHQLVFYSPYVFLKAIGHALGKGWYRNIPQETDYLFYNRSNQDDFFGVLLDAPSENLALVMEPKALLAAYEEDYGTAHFVLVQAIKDIMDDKYDSVVQGVEELARLESGLKATKLVEPRPKGKRKLKRRHPETAPLNDAADAELSDRRANVAFDLAEAVAGLSSVAKAILDADPRSPSRKMLTAVSYAIEVMTEAQELLDPTP